MDPHYEVIVYADDKQQDGQTAAFTDNQDQAAEIADHLRADGKETVEIRRFA